MVISINDASEIPIYQQIRNQIVLGISDGRLAPGEQLPTVRALAEEIGINSMTVSKAYTLLKQEGYIYTDRRSGARVRQEFETNKELSEKSQELLRQIGCDYAQGFLYARPMPAQDFIAFVARASGKDGEARL